MAHSNGKKRIGLISSWASRLGGGVFEAVVAHCDMIRAASFEPVVIALKDEYSDADSARFGATEVITVPIFGPGIIGYAPSMVKALLAADLDLLHLHGIWMYPSAAASAWSAKTGRPYIISPHGMLDPWIIGRGKLKKAIARAVYEKQSWRRADRFHALTEAEAADIRAVTGNVNIVAIPNAVELSKGAAKRDPEVVYLGRIHPKKNIDNLIRGWAKARDALSPINAKLKIAGWGDPEHVEHLLAQISAIGGDDITFLGPVYGDAKAKLIGGSSFVALPSHSEGLPMVVLEAWAAATPTIVSQHCHLPEGFENGAALDSGTDEDSIARALKDAFALSEEARRKMGAAAQRLINGRFVPSIISERWRTAYTSLMGTQLP